MTTIPNGSTASPAAVAAVASPVSALASTTPIIDELVDRMSERFRLGLEPGVGTARALDEAWKVAVAAFEAGLAPTAQQAYARILIGRPLGIPAMAAIQNIFLVENKRTGLHTVCMSAKAKLALCLSRRDLVEYLRPKSLSNTEAVWIGKRVDSPEPLEYKFTIEDARIAGLIDRGDTAEGKSQNNYNKHPGPMLQWRACGRLADILAADILTGIATSEEIEDAMAEQRAELAHAVADGRLAEILQPPPQAAKPPVRDYARELAALKQEIVDMIASKDRAKSKAVRATVEKLKTDAPAYVYDEALRFYNQTVGEAKRAPSAAHPAPAAAPAPTAYLPPNQRGDSYDGPENPPDELPFR